MNNRIKSLCFILAAILIILSGCGNTGSSAGSASSSSPEVSAVTASTGEAQEAEPVKELKEVTVAVTSSGIAYGALYLAQEENIWEKYGLKVNLLSLDPQAITAAVISGDVPIVSGGSNVVDAAIKTDRVKVVGTLGDVPFMFYGKGVSKIEDLKGKVIGVSAPANSTEYAAITMLESVGLEVGKDVEVLYIGNTALVSISEGKVDAGFLVPPMSIQADKLGLTRIATLSDIEEIRGTYMVSAVNTAYAEKNPDVITSYYQAYKEAVLLSRTEKEKTKAALSTWTKVMDEDALEFAYNYFVDFWPTDFHYPEDELQFLLDQLAITTNPSAKDVKFEDIMDNRYVDAVK